MPVVIACSACQGKMKVSEQMAGKAVKCPKCGQVVRTAPAPAPSPPPVPAAAGPKPPPAPAKLLLLTCPACQKKMQVRPELAGKAVKCPQCAKVVKVPGPAAPPSPAAAGDEEWLDVNEEAAPPPAAAGKGGPAAGDWGQGLMQEHRVPEEMQEELRAALGKGERLVWFDRPKMEILMYQARRAQLMGLALGVLVPIATVGGGIYMLDQAPLIVPIILFFFAVAFGAAGVYMAFLPAIQKKNADRRACFAVTNRRLLIHRGKGTQVRFGRAGGVGIIGDDGQGPVVAYVGLELTRLSRVEMRRFPGDGELLFGRSLFEQPYFSGMWALANVRTAERTIRERLINPVIDRLLRGEGLALVEKGDTKRTAGAAQGEEGDVIPNDANIKDYVSGRAAAVDPEDPGAKAAPARRGEDGPGNLRDVRLGVEYNPKKVPADQREQVEAELTEGEKILWVGEPEGKVEGRGLLGKLTGGAHRVEPRYTFFALTNRRVLIWFKFGWQGSNWRNRQMSWDHWGPASYYPTALRNAYVESDRRIPSGGSIVFKRVKRTIIYKDQKGGGLSTKRVVEMFHFGLLRVRNVKAVALLLYNTLIDPVRAL
jgi:hypothetical protein